MAPAEARALRERALPNGEAALAAQEKIKVVRNPVPAACAAAADAAALAVRGTNVSLQQVPGRSRPGSLAPNALDGDKENWSQKNVSDRSPALPGGTRRSARSKKRTERYCPESPKPTRTASGLVDHDGDSEEFESGDDAGDESYATPAQDTNNVKGSENDDPSDGFQTSAQVQRALFASHPLESVGSHPKSSGEENVDSTMSDVHSSPLDSSNGTTTANVDKTDGKTKKTSQTPAGPAAAVRSRFDRLRPLLRCRGTYEGMPCERVGTLAPDGRDKYDGIQLKCKNCLSKFTGFSSISILAEAENGARNDVSQRRAARPFLSGRKRRRGSSSTSAENTPQSSRAEVMEGVEAAEISALRARVEALEHKTDVLHEHAKGVNEFISYQKDRNNDIADILTNLYSTLSNVKQEQGVTKDRLKALKEYSDDICCALLNEVHDEIVEEKGKKATSAVVDVAGSSKGDEREKTERARTRTGIPAVAAVQPSVNGKSPTNTREPPKARPATAPRGPATPIALRAHDQREKPQNGSQEYYSSSLPASAGKENGREENSQGANIALEHEDNTPDRMAENATISVGADAAPAEAAGNDDYQAPVNPTSSPGEDMWGEIASADVEGQLSEKAQQIVDATCTQLVSSGFFAATGREKVGRGTGPRGNRKKKKNRKKSEEQSKKLKESEKETPKVVFRYYSGVKRGKLGDLRQALTNNHALPKGSVPGMDYTDEGLLEVAALENRLQLVDRIMERAGAEIERINPTRSVGADQRAADAAGGPSNATTRSYVRWLRCAETCTARPARNLYNSSLEALELDYPTLKKKRKARQARNSEPLLRLEPQSTGGDSVGDGSGEAANKDEGFTVQGPRKRRRRGGRRNKKRPEPTGDDGSGAPIGGGSFAALAANGDREKETGDGQEEKEGKEKEVDRMPKSAASSGTKAEDDKDEKDSGSKQEGSTQGKTPASNNDGSGDTPPGSSWQHARNGSGALHSPSGNAIAATADAAGDGDTPPDQPAIYADPADNAMSDVGEPEMRELEMSESGERPDPDMASGETAMQSSSKPTTALATPSHPSLSSSEDTDTAGETVCQ